MTCYVLQAGDTDKVKIGWAANVARRREHLQAGTWLRLLLIRTIPGARSAEYWMHRRFADQRIERDWFVFHPDMLTVELPRDLAAFSAPIRKAAVSRVIAYLGGPSAVAELMGVSQSVASDWYVTGKMRTARIEQLLAAARPSAPDLRPDHFFGAAEMPVPSVEAA